MEDARELQFQLVAPVLLDRLVEGLHPRLARVVDEPVQASSETVGGALGELPYGVGVPDVADARVQPVGTGAQAGRGLGEPVGVAPAGRDPGAFREQGADRGQADAGAAAGDQDGAVGEAEIHGYS